MCFAFDRDGKNPTHIAAALGRVDVLREFLRVKPESARERVKQSGRRGGTALHLCVEYGQFECLKVIVEDLNLDKDLINGKDENGNTVLHLAVADKQVETTEYLLSLAGIDLNVVNLAGMTPMDISTQRRTDSRDLEIEESLKHAGALGGTLLHKKYKPNRALLSPPQKDAQNNNDTILNKLLDQRDDWLEKKRSGLTVVASLIATMAFQAGVNPPNNVWKETKTIINSNSKDVRYYLTTAINYLKNSERFYLVNTTSFIASLSIILLLMSGLPLKRRFFVWVLMAVTWIAITAIALSYTVAVIISTPPEKEGTIEAMVGITVFAWICLMGLLLFGHTLRLFVKMIKVFFNLVKWLIRPLFRRRKTLGSLVTPRNNSIRC